ncbi:MAG TPA: crosslink repair DNA glycosylase YcaQ family protein [Acidimicrobiales bacterium]|nr:crosslink repair DNA glycosylase YcaQ family protein [Acidimicrobiales bacterium]
MPTKRPSESDTLSGREATRVSLGAQALRGTRLKSPLALVPHLRGVQLDTISVLARSHELVAYARLGAVPREKIEAAYWGPRSETFEYWSHAACVLPLELWPAFAHQRRVRRERGFRWHELKDHETSCASVLQRLQDEGPLTSRQLGGAKKGGVWWDWSEVKIAVEWLLDIGTVVCRERRGFERVYDLAERAIPSALLSQSMDDDACARELVESAGSAMGVATAKDLAAYHGMSVNSVNAVLPSTTLRPITVDGWRDIAYLAADADEALRPNVRHRTVLLSPFDSLLWDRARLERLFGIAYRLEAYVPAAKRVVGYFAMPVLAKERLVGLVDPKRDGSTLRARHVVIHDPRALDDIAVALREAASWVNCHTVTIERSTPGELLGELRSRVTTA